MQTDLTQTEPDLILELYFLQRMAVKPYGFPFAACAQS